MAQNEKRYMWGEFDIVCGGVRFLWLSFGSFGVKVNLEPEVFG
jgi:hypothetical protein